MWNYTRILDGDLREYAPPIMGVLSQKVNTRNHTEIPTSKDWARIALLPMYLPDENNQTFQQMKDNRFRYPSMNLSIERIKRGTQADRVITKLNDMVNEHIRYGDNDQGTYVISILEYKSIAKATQEEISSKIAEELPDLEELPYRAAFTVNPNHTARLYKSKETDLFIFLTSKLDEEITRKTLATIMYHMKFDPRPEYEAMCNALITSNRDEFHKLLHQVYSPLLKHMKDAEFKQNVEKTIRDIDRDRVERFDERIKDQREAIEETEHALRRRYEVLQNLRGQQLLAASMGTQGLEDFEQLLYSVKDKITYLSSFNSRVTFFVVQPLLYWDEEHYKMVRKGHDYKDSPKWRKQLLDDIFLNRTYTLNFHQGFRFYNNERVEHSYVGNAIDTDEMKGFPNPHLHYFDCWGDNKPIIEKALREGDIMKAYLQATATIAGMNLADGVVWNRFVTNALDTRGWLEIDCLTNNETKEKLSIIEYRRRFMEKEGEEQQ